MENIRNLMNLKRKSLFSSVLLVIADSDFYFMYVEVGATSDYNGFLKNH